MDALTVEGNLQSLKKIAEYVLAAAQQANLDKKTTYKLRLAVDEIATNIITHGYEEHNRSGDIVVMAKVTEESLTILLEDTGIAYDPSDIINQEIEQLNLSLEDRPIGGLGLYLAIEGVDHFSYERVDNINRNILVINL